MALNCGKPDRIRRSDPIILAVDSNMGAIAPSPQQMRDITLRIVTNSFDRPLLALLAVPRGPAAVAEARQTAMYLLGTCCGLTHVDVGRLFGRDRTTVAYAAKSIEERREDPSFDRILNALEHALRWELARLSR